MTPCNSQGIALKSDISEPKSWFCPLAVLWPLSTWLHISKFSLFTCEINILTHYLTTLWRNKKDKLYEVPSSIPGTRKVFNKQKPLYIGDGTWGRPKVQFLCLSATLPLFCFCPSPQQFCSMNDWLSSRNITPSFSYCHAKISTQKQSWP